MIIGQIHGSEDISSVPFVMLHDQGGSIEVVIKQQRSGTVSTRMPLLAGVPLNTPFTYSIGDDGAGTLAFTAAAGGHTASRTAPVPPAFTGATVRFQAGDYQQADSSGDAAPNDGARVTFHTLSTTA